MEILDRLVSVTQEHEELLLSWKVPAVGVSVYLLVVFILKLWMDGRKQPFEVKWIMAGHNFFLCAISLAMAVGTSYEAFFVKEPVYGLFNLFCSTDRHTVYGGRLFFWCVVFYLTKYYEFFDTVLLLLRKRPLLFLHVWHHCAVSVLGLIFLRANMTFFFTGVIINGTIHTFTYWFYFQNSLGNEVWWKKYLTEAQMIQFVWGMGSWLPWPFVCTHTRTTETDIVVIANILILGSFLLLFLNFFNHTYKKNPKHAKLQGKDTAKTTSSSSSSASKRSKIQKVE